ncbi:hypothetical protein [Jiulongibacter sp. NS-SX5]|uniref:hypothetical protein n=1 Tax=Jiulongibacter sp. NS-SX5 TaxID=3463854 RepID=UPI00405A3C9D
MSKNTISLLIGIGIASILAGVYAAYRSGEFMDAVSGIFIGISLIGTVLIEKNKTSQGK